MKKVLLICYSPRRIAPFLDTYIKFFEDAKIDYDYCTREIVGNHLDGDEDKNRYVFEYEQKNNAFSKIVTLLRWKRFISRILLNDYSGVVLLTCYPALILGHTMRKRFKSKYIVDIRDYFQPIRHKFIYRFLGKTIDDSYFTAISSKGFLKWLPSSKKYKTIHNLPSSASCVGKSYCSLSKGKKYCIGYFGIIHYYEENKKIISALANNESFKLIYGGIDSEPGRMRAIADDIGAENVEFSGEFVNSEKESCYSKVDFINAVYGNGSLTVRTALPNKLYDCIIYKKPIIVSKNTYLADVVTEFNLGIVLDLDGDILSQINSYIDSFDADKFINGANSLLEKSKNENEEISKLCRLMAGF